MKASKSSLAIVEVILVLPATMFMVALFVRNIQPQRYEPARSAQRLVDWFSARPRFGLDLCLIALPLAAFVIGSVSVWRTWRGDPGFRQAALMSLAAIRANLGSLLIGAATLVAGGILGIVALHMITD